MTALHPQEKQEASSHILVTRFGDPDSVLSSLIFKLSVQGCMLVRICWRACALATHLHELSNNNSGTPEYVGALYMAHGVFRQAFSGPKRMPIANNSNTAAAAAPARIATTTMTTTTTTNHSDL